MYNIRRYIHLFRVRFALATAELLYAKKMLRLGLMLYAKEKLKLPTPAEDLISVKDDYAVEDASDDHAIDDHVLEDLSDVHDQGDTDVPGQEASNLNEIRRN